MAWDRTIATQVGRESPFSVWGQAPALEPLKVALMAATALFAAALAFVPRTRDLLQVTALSAAVVIASQLILEHWFYLYIPWFLGPLLAAIAMQGVAERALAPAAQRDAVAPPVPLTERREARCR